MPTPVPTPPAPTPSPLDQALEALAAGRHGDAFSLLGPHPAGEGTMVVRVLQPAAREVTLLLTYPREEAIAMTRRHPDGVFEAVVPGVSDPARCDYRVRTHFASGVTVERRDPYHFGQVITPFDLHLFGEGKHLRLWDKLGAHVVTLGQTRGVHFAVWAPNAQRVSVVGDFNGWDGRVHVMRNLLPSGVWEIFVPDLDVGERYKFEVRTQTGQVLGKADPFAFSCEIPPRSASIVHDLAGTPGRTPSGSPRARPPTAGSIGRCPSTRCTSGRGSARPGKGRPASSRTTSSRRT